MKSGKTVFALLTALLLLLSSLTAALAEQPARKLQPSDVEGMSLDSINRRAVKLYDQGNYEEAFAYALYAAEKGHAAAQSNVAILYEDGAGVMQNDAESVRWIRLAAEQGYANAQNRLGVRYFKGKGVTQDYAQAFYWQKLAADQGLAIAQANLGLCYEDGKGIKQDIDEALRLYKLAAAQGEPYAFTRIGAMHEYGVGFAADDHKALEWYQLAAEKGDSDAMNFIGLLYEKEQGIGQDYQEALKWFQQAADRGLPAAQYNVGVYYEAGLSVPQDEAEAAKWYTLATDNGHLTAAIKLGLLYEEGRGVKEDLSEALRLYQLAAARGDEDAPEKVKRVEEKIKERALLSQLEEQSPPATQAPAATHSPAATPAPAPKAEAASAVSLTVEDRAYRLTLLDIGKDEEGKTSVSIAGTGGVVFFRNGQMVIPVHMRIVCGEKTYEYAGATVSTDKTTFTFETDQQPDMIYVYPYDKSDEQAESILLWKRDGDTLETAIPEELVGKWHGTGTPKNGGRPIDLTIIINADGSGEYTFSQGSYHESYPFTITNDDSRFCVDIPATSQLGSVEGTWALEDGVLKLDITSTFTRGGSYSYTAECEKVKVEEGNTASAETASASADPDAKQAGKEAPAWAGRDWQLSTLHFKTLSKDSPFSIDAGMSLSGPATYGSHLYFDTDNAMSSDINLNGLIEAVPELPFSAPELNLTKYDGFTLQGNLLRLTPGDILLALDYDISSDSLTLIYTTHVKIQSRTLDNGMSTKAGETDIEIKLGFAPKERE